MRSTSEKFNILIFSFCTQIFPCIIFLAWFGSTIVELSTSQYTYYHGPDNALVFGKVYGLMLSFPASFLLHGLFTRNRISIAFGLVAAVMLSKIAETLFLDPVEDAAADSGSIVPFPTQVSTFVLSLNIESGNCRRGYIERVLGKRGIPFKFIDAVNIVKASVDEVPLAKFYGMSTNAVMTESIAKSVFEGFNKSDSTSSSWILILEDDAVLHPRFTLEVSNLLDREEYDMIWLDVRSSPSYKFTGKIPCCTAGMLYNRSSALQIAKMLRSKSETVERIHKRRGMLPPNDLLLAALCNENVFKCTVVPLVSEVHFPSEH